jgi:hypothetical protein
MQINYNLYTFLGEDLRVGCFPVGPRIHGISLSLFCWNPLSLLVPAADFAFARAAYFQNWDGYAPNSFLDWWRSAWDVRENRRAVLMPKASGPIGRQLPPMPCLRRRNVYAWRRLLVTAVKKPVLRGAPYIRFRSPAAPVVII